ncbi:hypothetical protein HAHE_09120 [Haloferula helveola]|uniref:DUF4235 domain-containing protein n=1 Tax=Haloferula helveola TaxID=490095 RepID=A0ABN6H3M4_9BACT|nr:hypothetical protein HAHE_09120 [Haloferula helveola]
MHQHSKLARIAAIGAGFVLPAIAAKLARSSAGQVYRVATKSDPPRNPASRDVKWSEALTWTIAAGIVGAVARLATRRSLPYIGLPAEGLDMEEEVDDLD